MNPRTLLSRLLVVASTAACGSSDSSAVAQSGPANGGSSGAGGASAGAAGATTGGAAGTAGAAGTISGGAAGTGGTAGTGGAAGTGGTAGTGGAGGAGAGGAALCATGQTETPTKICFRPDGTTRDEISYPTGAAMKAVYPACTTMQRAATDACPAATAVCNWAACGLKQVLAAGPATKEGDDCCYQGALCYGPDSCGRPLLVDRRARVATLVRAAAWG